MYKIKFILLIFILLLSGCNTPEAKKAKPLVEKDTSIRLVKPESKKTLSVYGIEFNKKFNGAKATRPYHYNSDKNVVFKINEQNYNGLWFVLMELDTATRVVNKITFHLGNSIMESKETCLNFKNNTLNSFFNEYGGMLINRPDYKSEKSIGGSIRKSEGQLELQELLFTASCQNDTLLYMSYHGYTEIKRNDSIIQEENSKVYNDFHAISTKKKYKVVPKRTSGTGFFISNNGYLLTNYHVVKNSDRLQVFYKSKKENAKLVIADVKNDIAILKIENTTKAIPLNYERDTLKGSAIIVLGFPNTTMQGNEQKATFGFINSLTGLKRNSVHYQISAPIQPGNSGSPLIDDKGHVLGIISSTINQTTMMKKTGSLAQNVNYAIKIKFAIDLLNNNKISFESSNNNKVIPKTELIQDVSKSVVMIINESHL